MAPVPLPPAPPPSVDDGFLDSSSTVAGDGRVVRAAVTVVTGLDEEVLKRLEETMTDVGDVTCSLLIVVARPLAPGMKRAVDEEDPPESAEA